MSYTEGIYTFGSEGLRRLRRHRIVTSIHSKQDLASTLTVGLRVGVGVGAGVGVRVGAGVGAGVRRLRLP